MSNDNYFSEHWRGEHGLLMSCLLTGGIIGFALYALPLRLLYVGAIWFGLVLAGVGFQNPDISNILKATIFLATISFWIAPTLFWMIWAPVGIFRCGIRLASNKTTGFRRLGGVVAVIWAITIVVLAFQANTPIAISLWTSGVINPRTAFLEPTKGVPPKELKCEDIHTWNLNARVN